MLFLIGTLLAIWSLSTSNAKKCPVIPAVKNLTYQLWAKRPWLITHIDTKDELGYATNRRFLTDTYNLLYGSKRELQLKSRCLFNNRPLEEVNYGTLENRKKHTVTKLVPSCTIYETDYKSYSVIVCCALSKIEDDGKDVLITVFIYTRDTKGLSSDNVRRVEKELNDLGIEVDFKRLSWETCN